MSLAAGTRIGSYEILAPIGAGGMGEMYRAAAINVLPRHVSSNLAWRGEKLATVASWITHDR